VRQLKIACLGDTMCGDSFCCLGRGIATSLDRYGENFVPRNMAHLLRGHDMVFCNVETVLSDVGRKDYSLRSVHMRGRPVAAEYLAGWGLTTANVATNHILEHGRAAAIDTVKRLETAGIKTVGAGRAGQFEPGLQVAQLQQAGQPIALIGACLLNERFAFDGGAEWDEIIEATKSLSSEGKVVIVSLHWGDELMDRPRLRQRQLGRELIRAGASLVIGHHPHVVQAVERFEHGLIAYSLGNFIFDSFSIDIIWSMILSVELSGREVRNWQAHPIGKDRDHRPILLEGTRKDELSREIKRRCELLSSQVPEPGEPGVDYAIDQPSAVIAEHEQRYAGHKQPYTEREKQYTERELQYTEYERLYNEEFERLDANCRKRLRQELIRRFWHMKIVYWPQILWRPIQRRLGWW